MLQPIPPKIDLRSLWRDFEDLRIGEIDDLQIFPKAFHWVWGERVWRTGRQVSRRRAYLEPASCSFVACCLKNASLPISKWRGSSRWLPNSHIWGQGVPQRLLTDTAKIGRSFRSPCVRREVNFLVPDGTNLLCFHVAGSSVSLRLDHRTEGGLLFAFPCQWVFRRTQTQGNRFRFASFGNHRQGRSQPSQPGERGSPTTVLKRSQEPIPQQFWNITHAHPGHSLALRRFTPHTLTHTHTFEFGVVAWRMGGIRRGGNHRQSWFGPGGVQLGRDSLWWGKGWGASPQTNAAPHPVAQDRS